MSLLILAVIGWFVVGAHHQFTIGVIPGLLFAYQYIRSPLDWVECICMLLVTIVLWPIGPFTIDVVGWIGKMLGLEHYK